MSWLVVRGVEPRRLSVNAVVIIILCVSIRKHQTVHLRYIRIDQIPCLHLVSYCLSFVCTDNVTFLRWMNRWRIPIETFRLPNCALTSRCRGQSWSMRVKLASDQNWTNHCFSDKQNLTRFYSLDQIQHLLFSGSLHCKWRRIKSRDPVPSFSRFDE